MEDEKYDKQTDDSIILEDVFSQDTSSQDSQELQEQYIKYHTARYLPKVAAELVGFSKTALQQYTASFREFMPDILKTPNGYNYYSDADVDFLTEAYRTCREKGMTKEAYKSSLKSKKYYEYPDKSVALVKQIQSGYSKQIEQIRESITESQSAMSAKIQDMEDSIEVQKNLVKEQTKLIEEQNEIIKDLAEKLDEATQKKKKRFLLF